MARKSKKQITVEQIDAQLAKWMGTIIRATRTIERLQRMRKRAVKKASAPTPIEAAPILKQAETMQANMTAQLPPKAPAESVERPAEKPAPTPPADDLAIPGFLKRGKEAPETEQLRAELAEHKRLKTAGRIAKMKAKASGETRKMPLTGRAALAAIRNG